MRSSPPSLYVQLFRKSREPLAFHLTPESEALRSLAANDAGPAKEARGIEPLMSVNEPGTSWSTHLHHVVGYRAPWRCSRCKAMTAHPSGTSGLVSSRPKVLEGTEYQGLRRDYHHTIANISPSGRAGHTSNFPNNEKRRSLS